MTLLANRKRIIRLVSYNTTATDNAMRSEGPLNATFSAVLIDLILLYCTFLVVKMLRFGNELGFLSHGYFFTYS